MRFLPRRAETEGYAGQGGFTTFRGGVGGGARSWPIPIFCIKGNMSMGVVVGAPGVSRIRPSP
jgi:hypothetical protein